ncbi:DegT/DnrJ/EryC1/StrS family aminotransferase [bacterium]|jgi:dTDP-4-amino-4,6-dideoxygalactose transaminase|nr:DegT/DnrJ/EryC1/StrS family aminotransferase [bacterium]
MTNVPLLDLGPQNRALEPQFEAVFREVLRSNQFIMGPRLEAFEKDCAAFLGVKHALGVSSGTDALLLALMALDVGEGDEVLLPAFTFFATAGSVVRLGATPVWVDVDPHHFNLDLADAARKVGPRTRAIMPVHLFGQSGDLDALQAFAAAHKLRVVEDAAQSMGARWKGRATMSVGDFGATSFFPSKNLGGMGDSGLVTTQDDALAERARILRVHGMQPKYHHREVGANFRMDPLQAALLHLKLPHLPSYNCARAGNAIFYQTALKGVAGIAENRPGADRGARLLLPVDFSGQGIWNQFTLRVPGGRRDALKAFLTARKIGCEIYYPIPLHRQQCFADRKYRGFDGLPVSEQLAAEVLSIPIFPELSGEQRQWVADSLADFAAGKIN